MHSIQKTSWDELGAWCDQHLTLAPSYVAEANNPKYPRDAFSLGQLASKAWLLKELYPIATHPIKDWVIIGCWVAAIVPLLHKRFIINRIYGIDLDQHSIELSEVFNRKYVEDDWKYKGVIMDINYQEARWLQFETGFELIQTKPGVIVNTSCEHMNTEWFEGADSDQLIVMQTNNSKDFDGHINTCESISQLQDKYPMRDIRYIGEFKMPTYTRYMQIGYK